MFRNPRCRGARVTARDFADAVNPDGIVPESAFGEVRVTRPDLDFRRSERIFPVLLSRHIR